MNWKIFLLSLVAVFLVFLAIEVCGGEIAHGRCPQCGQVLDSQWAYYAIVPRSMPCPQDEEWIKILDLALQMEMLCKARYENDRLNLGIRMPYQMIIPQDNNHIIWLSELFNAYGLKPQASVPTVEIAETLSEAYNYALKMEDELNGLYSWLIRHAQDEQTCRVLDTIRCQNELQSKMFRNALDMAYVGGTLKQ